MHMKWKLFFLNALFWIVAFSMKIPFDYYIICLPSVPPVRLTNWSTGDLSTRLWPHLDLQGPACCRDIHQCLPGLIN